MPRPTAAFKLMALLLIFSTILACQNTEEIPFPLETEGYAEPETTPLKFDKEEQLKWPEPKNLTSIPATFNYDRLPVILFDSLGFQPNKLPRSEVSFNWDKLPSAEFKFENLPEIPLQFKTSLLPQPNVIKVARPVLKVSRADVMYDFGGVFNGVSINQLYKTRDGFTWIVTSRGLYRYDGETLLHYAINGLRSIIADIAEDADGHIWIGSRNNGAFELDIKNGVSRQLILPVQGNIYAARLMVDHIQRVWITTIVGLFRVEDEIKSGTVYIVDKQHKKVKLFRKEDGLSHSSPFGLIQDKLHRIWITTIQGGMTVLDLDANRVCYLRNSDGTLYSDSLSSVYEDHLDRIWINGISGGLNVMDINAGKLIKFGRGELAINFVAGRIIQDRYHNIWIPTPDGVNVFDPSVKLMKSINRGTGMNSSANIRLMEDNRGQVLIGNSSGLNIISKNAIRRAGNAQISTMLEDSRGRIWIGTLDKGIQIIDTATGLIRVYNMKNGLQDDFIQYIIENNGRIVISTSTGGIEIIDTSLKKTERIGAAQGITPGNITAMDTDKDNNIWIAGTAEGIDILDMKNKKVRHIGAAEGLLDSTIIDIKRDAKGRMWFYSFNNGVGVIDPSTKTVKHIRNSEFSLLTGEAENNLLLHDERGNTWLSSSVSGLYFIHPAGDSITHFTIANGLLSNSMLYMKEYHGTMYVGTRNGLNILTPPLKTSNKKWNVESLDKLNGIVKNISSYNSDLLRNNGEYWWGDDGITIISKLDNWMRDTVAPATFITGIDIINRRQNFSPDPWKGVNKNDTLWKAFGKTDTFFVNRESPLQEDRKIEWDSVTGIYNMPVNLVLPYNKNYIQFHYAQNHLGSQDTVWYRYILEGVDQKWSEKTEKASSENYPNLSYGKYTFRVSSYYRGRWSDPVSFSFTVLPPWWRTWWAWLIYIAASAAVLRAYVMYRSRKLKRENKILEVKVELRTTQLQKTIDELKSAQSQLIQAEKMASLGELTAGIAHEIQNPLNFINNFSDINREMLQDIKQEMANGNISEATTLVNDVIVNEQKINHHGKRADGIVKGMLQHSRSGTAVKEPTDINKLADEYFRLAYHGLRARDNSFNAVLKSDYDESIGKVNIIGQEIGRAVLNLVTNAFYAVTTAAPSKPAGFQPTVAISTKKVGEMVEIRVKDNGTGIPQPVLDKIFQPFFTTKPAGKGTGLGLSISYDIITKGHGGHLKVETQTAENGKEGGTSFTISLPINGK